MAKRKNFLVNVLSAHVPLKRLRMISLSDDVTIGSCPMCYDETYVTLHRIDKVMLVEVFPQGSDLWVCEPCSKTLIGLKDLKLLKVKIEKRIEQIVCCIKAVLDKKEDLLGPMKNYKKDHNNVENSKLSQELEINGEPDEHFLTANNELEMYQIPLEGNNWETNYMELEVTDEESETDAKFDKKKVFIKSEDSHNSDLDNDVEFRCKDCGKYFTSYPVLQYHLRKQGCVYDLWRLFCETCSIGFSTFEDLNQHKQATDCERKTEHFLCGHCQKKFSDKWMLLNHLKYSECNENASKIFEKVEALSFKQNQMKIEKEMLGYLGDDDENVSELNFEKRNKEFRTRPYCHNCKQKFSRNYKLRLHFESNMCTQKESKSAISNDPFCKKCLTGFSTEYDLNRHGCLANNLSKIKFSCGHCQSKFAQQRHIFRHIQMGRCRILSQINENHKSENTNGKKYSNKIANDVWSSKFCKNLAKDNNSEKPHCNICKKKFATEYSVLRHMKNQICLRESEVLQSNLQNAAEEIQKDATEIKSEQVCDGTTDEFNNFIKKEPDNEIALEESLPTFKAFEEEHYANILQQEEEMGENIVQDKMESEINLHKKELARINENESKIKIEYLDDPISPEKLEFLKYHGLF